MIFFIPGIPKSTQTGSIVRIGKRVFPKRMNTPWSAYVRLVMQQHRPSALYEGPLAVCLEFIMPDLVSSKRAFPTVRPDLDNLQKGFLDAGNGVLWCDDAQIVDLTVTKRYAKTTAEKSPGVLVTVYEKGIP